MKQLLEQNKLVMMEAAIIEQLRRSENVRLDELLLHAPLIYDAAGKMELNKLYQSYLDIANQAEVPFLMCTPTWRTNKARVFGSDISHSINADAAQFLINLRKSNSQSKIPVRIGGMIGCKNDAYKPSEGLSASESEIFHSWQIDELGKTGVDFLIAETLPNIEEAIGISRAMESTGLPYIISFVINRNGYVLDGTSLYDAVNQIDDMTRKNPLGYMINCAYPTFLCAERQPENLFSRLIGFQANASSLDHRDLDNADELKSEKISVWGNAMLSLHRVYGLKILGGCCGTSGDHLRYIVSP